MGKQSNKPTAVSQEQYNKDLDKSLEILHKDGASDQELIDYTNDYKSRFTVAKPKDNTTTQKKNPNANKNGVSNSGTGSSGSQKIDPKTGFPKIDTTGILPNFEDMKSVSKPVVAKPALKEEKKNTNTVTEDTLNRKIKINNLWRTSHWEKISFLDREPSTWEFKNIERKKSLHTNH